MVSYLFGERSRCKTADIEILDHDQAEGGYQTSCEFMGMVMPEVANPLMPAGKKESRLLSPMRALLPTAQSPLDDPKTPPRRTVGPRARYLLPRGQSGKVQYAKIQSHCWLSGRSNLRRSGDRKRKGRVPASRHSSHGGRPDRRRRRQRAMPLHLDVADALQDEAGGANAEA